MKVAVTGNSLLLWLSCSTSWLVLPAYGGQAQETNFLSPAVFGQGMEFWFGFSKSNFTCGESVFATMFASNALDIGIRFFGLGGFERDVPFGDFEIVDQLTLQKLEPFRPPGYRDFVSSGGFLLHPHECIYNSCDLKTRYGLTNAGVYSIQAKGYFMPTNESDRGYTLATPPLTFTIVLGAGTNGNESLGVDTSANSSLPGRQLPFLRSNDVRKANLQSSNNNTAVGHGSGSPPSQGMTQPRLITEASVSPAVESAQGPEHSSRFRSLIIKLVLLSLLGFIAFLLYRVASHRKLDD